MCSCHILPYSSLLLVLLVGVAVNWVVILDKLRWSEGVTEEAVWAESLRPEILRGVVFGAELSSLFELLLTG